MSQQCFSLSKCITARWSQSSLWNRREDNYDSILWIAKRSSCSTLRMFLMSTFGNFLNRESLSELCSYANSTLETCWRTGQLGVLWVTFRPEQRVLEIWAERLSSVSFVFRWINTISVGGDLEFVTNCSCSHFFLREITCGTIDLHNLIRNGTNSLMFLQWARKSQVRNQDSSSRMLANRPTQRFRYMFCTVVSSSSSCDSHTFIEIR